MTALEHFEHLYGEFALSPNDAARWVFASGWNCAMQEALERVKTMPIDDSTKAAFAVYFQTMMHVDPSIIQARMQ